MSDSTVPLPHPVFVIKHWQTRGILRFTAGSIYTSDTGVRYFSYTNKAKYEHWFVGPNDYTTGPDETQARLEAVARVQKRALARLKTLEKTHNKLSAIAAGTVAVTDRP